MVEQNLRHVGEALSAASCKGVEPALLRAFTSAPRSSSSPQAGRPFAIASPAALRSAHRAGGQQRVGRRCMIQADSLIERRVRCVRGVPIRAGRQQNPYHLGLPLAAADG